MFHGTTSAESSHRVFHRVSALFHKLKTFTAERRSSFPLTARAIIILIGTMYLFLGPIKLHDDIVSSVLASTALGLVLLGVVAVFVSGFLLRRTLKLEIIPPATNDPQRSRFLEAETPLLFVLKTNAVRVIPFLALDVHIEFDRPGELLPKFRLTGSKKKAHILTTETVFPHRGVWNAMRVRYVLGDRAGLVRYAWSEPIERELRVGPREQLESSLPVISSSNRPGDLVTDLHNRQGEMYDMKQYHPSDGMKRIVWKVFARRGELLSRHPEASMTPEGQVVLYALARSPHDDPAREMISYARKLRDLQLELFIGCEGMGDQSPARTPENALELLIESAWDADTRTEPGSQSELLRFLAASVQGHSDIQLARVVLFVAANRLSTSKDKDQLISIGTLLESQGIEPVWILSSHPSDDARRKPPKRNWGVAALRRGSRLLIQPQGTPETTSEFSMNFLETCLARKWHVIV